MGITGRLLDLEYVITVDDPALEEHLPTLFADSLGPVEQPEHFRLTGKPGDRFELTRNGEPLTSTDSGSHALSSLVWHMNRSVVSASGARMLFHASVVVVDGASVAFLGSSGDGKTTSAVAFARRHSGRLVSDDLIAISSTGEITGSAKPLGLRDGSFAVLGLDLADVPLPPDAYRGSTVYVAGGAIGAPVVERTRLTDVVQLATESGPTTPQRSRSSVGFAGLLGAAFDHRRLPGDEVRLLASQAKELRFWEWRPNSPTTLDGIRPTRS